MHSVGRHCLLQGIYDTMTLHSSDATVICRTAGFDGGINPPIGISYLILIHCSIGVL